LVRILTSIQPYEPHWEHLKVIDLSNRHVDSLARLKELVPNLDKLIL
jgi:protein NUD1